MLGFCSSLVFTLACAEDDEPKVYYQRCDSACRAGGDEELCLIGESNEGPLEICAPHCEDSDDCEDATTPAGSAPAVCSNQGFCVVQCVSNETCPQPMICEEWAPTLLQPSNICMWRT